MVKKIVTGGISLVNLLALALLGWLAARPDGPLRAEIDAWRYRRAQEQAVQAAWSTLVGGRRLDAGEGDIELVEFGDYECPFCRALHPVIKAFIEDHPDVGISYRHMPLTSIHSSAFVGAMAAVCAEGQARFVAMHDALLTDTEWLVTGDVMPLAMIAGIPDAARFEACLNDTTAAGAVRADSMVGASLGLAGTPAIVRPSSVLTGLVTGEELSAIWGEVSSSKPPPVWRRE